MSAPAAACTGVAARVAAVRDRIERACERARRDPASVTLVAVSKTFDAAAVLEAWDAGVRDFGENRVQEALPKIAAVAERGVHPTWHLVGHLQSNKARQAAGAFALLHGVDSVSTLERLAAAPSPATVLLEVNVSGEPSKAGVAPECIGPLLRQAGNLQSVTVTGLMTVAPLSDDAEAVRPVFRWLAALGREHGLDVLSMGMTNDFEVAIEEGATHVRIGRAVFGERSA